MKLHTLIPLVKKRKRIGRGGSRGGTSGRGHKGQKARTSGTVRPGFEGGQMPLYRRLPKRGFSQAPFKKEIVIINLDRLEIVGKEGEEITKELLLERGAIKAPKSNKSGFILKVLADGSLTKKLTVCADACSESARKAIEKVGGSVRLLKEIE